MSRLKVDEKVRHAQQFKQMSDNPAVNVPTTFIEPYPIGLAYAAVSAGPLRDKARDPDN